MAIVIEPLAACDAEAAYAVERESFSVPWSLDALVRELTENKIAVYLAAVRREDKARELIGYCGMWHIVNEGHITNIAVLPRYRRMGVGTMLLSRLLDIASERRMLGLTLEVRMGNRSAMGLYHKFGFKAEGIRKNYYEDTGEDAVIMWKYL